MMPSDIRSHVVARCAELIHTGQPCVLVTLAEAIGSTPQDSAAKMLVTSTGLDCGTVGGGRVEAQAIEHAKGMISSKANGCEWVDWNLKADVGMTCGGSVKLLFEGFGTAAWKIVIFGAGHVSQSLTQLLTSLPCQVTCIDSRSEWLEQLPATIERVHLESPENYVSEIPSQASVLCMTKGHRSDLPVLQQIYRSDVSFAFVGVIGSKAKAAVLRKELKSAGIDADKLDFQCPVGLPIGSNHPGEIAVSIAAQLLEVRDKQQALAPE